MLVSKRMETTAVMDQHWKTENGTQFESSDISTDCNIVSIRHSLFS